MRRKRPSDGSVPGRVRRLYDGALPKRDGRSFLAPPVVCVDLHPPRPQERLGLALRHLDRAVGRDVEKEHIAMADAGRDAQPYPTPALGLAATKLFGALPVKLKDPAVGAGA